MECTGLSIAQLKPLDSFHRGQLRRVLGIFYPKKITPRALYARAKTQALSLIIAQRRWQFFGKILRLSFHKPQLPAFLAMERFYACRNIAERKQHADMNPEIDYTYLQIQPRRVTPHNTIYRNITRDLAHHPKSPIIYTLQHLYEFREMALDKDKWNNFYLTIERFRRRHKLSDITIGDLSKLQNPNKKRSYDAIANPELIVRRLVRRLTFMNRPPAVIP